MDTMWHLAQETLFYGLSQRLKISFVFAKKGNK
jgi:hypothetical protein